MWHAPALYVPKPRKTKEGFDHVREPLAGRDLHPHSRFAGARIPPVMSRISAERMTKAQEQLKTISPEENAKVKAIANIVRPLRSFLFKSANEREKTVGAAGR